MLPFVEWVRQNPVYIRDSWSFEKNRFVGSGILELEPKVQIPIFNHCLTPDEEGVLPYQTLLYSTTKKSGKTQIAAAITAWYADQSVEGTEIYLFANSKEQASSRVFKDLKYHFRKKNESLEALGLPLIKVLSDKIEFPNETFIQVLSQNYSTAAGARHGLTVWDELWAFYLDDHVRLWDEMTPIPTVTNSLRLVVTYAGVYNESMLLWDLYKKGVGTEEHEDGQGKPIEGLTSYDLPAWRSGNQFTYWNHDPTMPWQTDEYYLEQLASLRPAAYLRLHENRWVDTHETFIPIEWWTKAASNFIGPATQWKDHPYSDAPIFVGVDGSTKHDTTAVVGVTYDQNLGKTALVFHRIWTPQPGKEFNLEATVADYILEMALRFNIHSIHYDPKQLHQIMVNLRAKGFRAEEFTQQGKWMTSATEAMYDALKFGNLLAYPDDEIESHLRNALVKEEAGGFRLVKDKSSKVVKKPMDFCVALAMALHRAVWYLGMVSTKPIVIDAPFADLSTRKTLSEKEKQLPWMLRS